MRIVEFLSKKRVKAITFNALSFEIGLWFSSGVSFEGIDLPPVNVPHGVLVSGSSIQAVEA